MDGDMTHTVCKFADSKTNINLAYPPSSTTSGISIYIYFLHSFFTLSTETLTVNARHIRANPLASTTHTVSVSLTHTKLTTTSTSTTPHMPSFNLF